MIFKLACIVEGHGEVSAVPILLRRLAAEIDCNIELTIPQPIRLDRSKLKRDGELEKAMQLAIAKIDANGGVLILMDSDDDCPAQLGPALLKRARSIRPDFPVSVVIATREYESWFIAAAPSLSQRFHTATTEVGNVESIRGAKEWLQKSLKNNRYSPTVDQPSLTAQFNLQQARSASSSFDKLWREIAHMLSSKAV